MDLENIESWVAQPDVCRCCLSASGTWDVTASYITESGLKEVYFEMLRDCYGITLSYLTEWGPSHMVCKLCVSHLRDASSFKKQVLRAEKYFNNYFNTREKSTALVTVKKQENIEASSPAHSEGVHSDEDAHTDDENDKKPTSQLLSSSAAKIMCSTKIKSERVKNKRERQQPDKVKRKKIKTEPDYDSDTPIASLTDKKELSSDVKKVEITINNLKDYPGVVKAQKGPVKMLEKKKIPSQTQSVIENSLRRSNTTLIIKNTTIVPFRPINNTKFGCLYCEQGFLFFKELETHLDSHKDITEVGITSSLKKQRTNSLINADVSEVACRLCGEDLKNIDNAIDHLVEVHKKIYHKNVKINPTHGILGFDLSSEQLKCIICQKQFSFFKNLSIHMNEHSTSFMCHVCGKKFISDQRMQAHIMMLHNRTKILCKHCNKDFKTVAAMQHHLVKEHNKAPYKCPECTETFIRYRERLKHMVECHKFEKPVYKCDICGRELTTAGGLGAHKRYSHLKTQFPCELCGKVFTHKSVWKRHIKRVHTGAKIF